MTLTLATVATIASGAVMMIASQFARGRERLGLFVVGSAYVLYGLWGVFRTSGTFYYHWIVFVIPVAAIGVVAASRSEKQTTASPPGMGPLAGESDLDRPEPASFEPFLPAQDPLDEGSAPPAGLLLEAPRPATTLSFGPSGTIPDIGGGPTGSEATVRRSSLSAAVPESILSSGELRARLDLPHGPTSGKATCSTCGSTTATVGDRCPRCGATRAPSGMGPDGDW